MKNFCIINVAIGAGYENLQIKQKQWLDYVGYTGDVLYWTTYPDPNFDNGCVYNIKASAIEQAISLGYEQVMWLDASFYSIRHPMPIIEIIKSEGHYFINNGYNAAQECNDRCLDYFSITRDEAESIQMLSSGILGLDLTQDKPMEFARQFIRAAKNGVFYGSRRHDGQSQDARFLHHRQDQSAASCIAYKLDMKVRKLGEQIMYNDINNPDDKPEGIIFKIQGA